MSKSFVTQASTTPEPSLFGNMTHHTGPYSRAVSFRTAHSMSAVFFRTGVLVGLVSLTTPSIRLVHSSHYDCCFSRTGLLVGAVFLK